MNIAGHSDGFWVLADSAASKSNPGRTEGAIRRLYNAFWDIDSFCIYQQGLTDIMHTWSLGILDYVIFSVVNEMISYLRSFKLRKTSRRQGEEFHPPLFTDAFIRRLFTDEVPKLVRNIDQNTAGLILPESTASAGENSKLFVAEKHNLGQERTWSGKSSSSHHRLSWAVHTGSDWKHFRLHNSFKFKFKWPRWRRFESWPQRVSQWDNPSQSCKSTWTDSEGRPNTAHDCCNVQSP